MSGRSRDTPLGWLLLNGLACRRNKTVNGQSLTGHHVFKQLETDLEFSEKGLVSQQGSHNR